MPELDVRVRPVCLQSLLCLPLARHDCARKLGSNQLLPNKGRDNHGSTASVVSTAAPAHDQVSTRGAWLEASNAYFKKLPSDPKLRTVSPAWSARRAV